MQGWKGHCSAPVTWGLPMGPGIKEALHRSSGHIPKGLAQHLTALLGPEVASQPCPGPAEACGWEVLGKGLCWAFPPLFLPLAPAAALWLLSTPGYGKESLAQCSAPTLSQGHPLGHISPCLSPVSLPTLHPPGQTALPTYSSSSSPAPCAQVPTCATGPGCSAVPVSQPTRRGDSPPQS